MTRFQALALGEKWYYTGRPCKQGHITFRQTSNGACKVCASERGKAFYHHPDNAERLRGAARARMRAALADPAARRELNEKRRQERADPERRKVIREREIAYAIKRPEVQKKKQRRQREKRKSDPIASFFHRASNLIRLTLQNGNWSKSKRTEQILGCSIEQFASMIERQFLPGMTWANKGQWHLDHIVPISTAKTQEEAEALSRAGNFRPIWAADNLAKSNSILFLI